MNTSWLKSGLKIVGVLAVAAALSGCVVAPYGYGPRYGYGYGYYHHPRVWGYY